MTSKEGLRMSPKVHFMQGMFLYGEMEDILNEVAPPGFGHTKSGKGDKKGGTAAAFDRARKEGRFKGSKSDMFAIMWSQKNKGDKPHYKPGTDEKKKKYQEEIQGGISMQDYDPNMKFRDYEFIDVIKAEPLKKTIEESYTETKAKERQKFVDFYKKAKASKAKKQSDAVRSDSKKHGIKFTDSRGSGRMRGGRKHYD